MTSQSDISLLLTFRAEMIDPSLPTGLWWCATPEDAAAVGINAVCKNRYAAWEDLAVCTEFITQFCYVFVATPNDADREEIVGQLQKWVPVTILVADKAAFRGNESVVELLDNAGPKAVESLLFGALDVPRPGLIDLSQVEMDAPISQNRMMSGLVPLDYCTGGFRGGELSVWTGRRGEGKSTLLGQMLVESINQNRTVCAYSGELPARQFKRFVLPQIAGPRNLVEQPDPRTGRMEYAPSKGAVRAIDQWLEGSFLLTDLRQSNAHDEDNILRLFEYAYRRYGCSVYLVDNIMTASLKGEVELGHYGAQKAFTQRLSAFAKRHDVHVHLVAHPRKAGEERGLTADDVAGAAEITNLADNVFSVERAKESDEVDSRIRIIKARETGSREVIPLMFDAKSRRYYDAGGNPTKRYSWEAARDGHG